MIERYEDIERLTILGIKKLVAGARGDHVLFKPKKLAKIAGLSTKPVTLTLVRHVLEELRAKGIVDLWSTNSHGYKYIITRDSPLWKEVKAEVMME